LIDGDLGEEAKEEEKRGVIVGNDLILVDSALDKLTERGDPGALFRTYAFPAMVNMVVMALYNVVDRIFIGQGAGAMAICGLALTLPCVALATTVGTLTGGGAAARIHSAVALGNRRLACQVLGNAILLNLLLSGVLIGLFFGWMEPVLKAFGGSEHTIPYARAYLSVIIPGTLLTNFNFTCCHAIRAAGQTRKSALIILTGVIVNMLLDPVFIFGFHLGIEGAAIATVLSMGVTSGLVIRQLCKKNTYFSFSWKGFQPRFHILVPIVGMGMAAFIMNITTGMVNIIMNRYLVHHGGDYAIGAYGIISCYSILIAMLLMGICQGVQPLMACYYGGKQMQQVREILRMAVRTATVVAIAGFVITELTAPGLVAVFTEDTTLRNLSTEGLRLTFLLMPLTGFQVVVTGFFQSTGKAPQAIVMNMSRQFIFLIPALGLFSGLWGLTGIWLALPFTDFMAAIVAAILLRINNKQ